MAGLGFFASLVGSALMSDDKNANRTLENAGKSAIIRMLGGPASPFAMIFESILAGGNIRDEVKDKVIGKLKSRKYIRAHQAWLDNNRWRFDWRSQPRRPAGTDAGGEWMDGRLDYPVGIKAAMSRKQRRQRVSSMKAYRERERRIFGTKSRTIQSSWSDR